MSYIIDAHSHYLPIEVAEKTAFFKQGWSDIDRHLLIMDQCHIDKALLVYPTSDAHIQMGGWENLCQIYNQKLSEVIKKNTGRFIGAGILPIDEPHQFRNELIRIRDLGLRVISLASSYDGQYLDSEVFYPIYDFAQRNKMPIHIHPQIMNPIGEDRVRDALLTPVLEYVFDISVCIGKMMMGGAFLKFPEVKFIFAHFGGVLPLVKERFDSTYRMLRKREFVKDIYMLPSEYFKNLYFDTSGTKSMASLMCALEVVVSSSIFLGSDFPANPNIVEAVSMVKNSALSEKQKIDILQSNVLKLL